MDSKVYKEIYKSHKDIFNEVIKHCPHKPTVKLIKAQMRSDDKLLASSINNGGVKI